MSFIIIPPTAIALHCVSRIMLSIPPDVFPNFASIRVIPLPGSLSLSNSSHVEEGGFESDLATCFALAR